MVHKMAHIESLAHGHAAVHRQEVRAVDRSPSHIRLQRLSRSAVQGHQPPPVFIHLVLVKLTNQGGLLQSIEDDLLAIIAQVLDKLSGALLELDHHQRAYQFRR